MEFYKHLKELNDHSVAMFRYGLVPGLSGNASLRISDNAIAITPSGIPYNEYQPDKMCIIDSNGKLTFGTQSPSSETPMHTAIYQKLSHVHAIIHTHSPYVMTFAVLAKPIAVISLEGLGFGVPEIPCMNGFILPGSRELGEKALSLFEEKPSLKAILLQNHGALIIADNIHQAVELAANLEITARIYYQALCIGSPVPLTEKQITDVNSHYFELKSKLKMST